MTKEFVPYPEALELKELGFDEPCFGNWQDMKEETPWFSKSFTDRQNQFYGQLCSAPTFSQAFRWFREKHGLFQSVCYQDDNSGTGGFDCEILNKRGKQLNQADGEYIEYASHEEAELACLRKLIEIVKTKQI